MINHVLSVGGVALSTSKKKKVAAATAMTTNDCLSLIVSNSFAFILHYALILTQHYSQQSTLFLVESELGVFIGGGISPIPNPQKNFSYPLDNSS